MTDAERKQRQRKKQGPQKYAEELKTKKETYHNKRTAEKIAPGLLLDIELTEKHQAEMANFKK